MRSLLELYLKPFRGLSREVWLLSLVMLINRAGTMVIPFLTLYLTKQLGFTLGEAGWVLSCFGVGSVIGTWVGGKLTDKFSYYEVQFWSLTLSGGLFLVLMQIQTLFAWCVGVALTSSIAEAFRPANMTAIGVYSKPENLTRSITLNRLAINLGWAIGPALAGWLVTAWGYPSLFVVNCTGCLAAAVIFRISLKRQKRPDRSEAPQKLQMEVSVFKDRNFLLFVFLQFLVMVGFMQVFSTLPVFLEQTLQFNERSVGMLIGFNGLVIALTEMPLIAWVEKRFRTLRLVRGGMLFIAGSLLLLLWGEAWIGFVWLYMLGITIGEMINFPFGQTYALSLTEPHNRGRYMGAYGLSFSAAFIVAPWLGSHLVAWASWSTLWLLLSGITFVAALGVGRLPGGGKVSAKTKPKDRDVVKL